MPMSTALIGYLIAVGGVRGVANFPAVWWWPYMKRPYQKIRLSLKKQSAFQPGRSLHSSVLKAFVYVLALLK